MQPAPPQHLIATATWLRHQRLRAGLSQRDLADRLGLPFQDLASGYEGGQRRVGEYISI
jgi:transcriptional regulator with XRE-family HTH domain